MRKVGSGMCSPQSPLVSGRLEILFTSVCSALTSTALNELKVIRQAQLEVKFRCLVVLLTLGVLKIVRKR